MIYFIVSRGILLCLSCILRSCNMKKICIFTVVLALLFGTGMVGADETSLNGVQSAFDTFSTALTKSLPFGATVGLNWSDAYIGQLIGTPPHFGVGASAGFTTMDVKAVQGLLDVFGVKQKIPFMPLPAYTVEGRIGGFGFPFDIGVKFGMLRNMDMSKVVSDGFKFDYLLAGGDIRYALLKENAALPNVSVGLGVSHLRGGVSVPFGNGMSFSFTDLSNVSHTISVDKPTARLSWQTTVVELKAQVSKTFLIFTPYLGAGLSYGWSETGYEVKAGLSYDGKPATITPDQIATIKSAVPGLNNVSTDGFSTKKSMSAFGFRLFGGLSFNLAVIRIDLTGMFNVRDKNWGATAGLRFQL